MADKPSITAFMRPRLPDAALYGLPGKIATQLAEVSGADPAAILVFFLTGFGNVIGRHPHIMLAGAEHPAREFAVVVGDAATGRKGTAWGAVKSLLREAEPEWPERIARGEQSPEAVVDKLDDARQTDTRLMIIETEFARLMRKIDRIDGMGEMLRNAWDGEPLERIRANKYQKATEHHISIIGMITPSELLRLHNTLSDAGGLESRVLYCISAPDREIDPFAYVETPKGLVGEVADCIDYALNYVLNNTDPISAELCLMAGIMPPAKAEVSDSVRYGWRKLVKDNLPEMPEQFSPYIARAEAHIVRIALMYALADKSTTVREEHINAALALWEFCARCAERIFSIPVGKLAPEVNPAKVAKVYRYLHDVYPGWASGTDISVEALGRNSTSAEIKGILESLLEQELITYKKVKPVGSGKPRTDYRLTAKS